MLALVVYDISENKARNNFINRLRHYGLRRLQKSVFIGDLNIDSRLDLAEEFDQYLSSEKDSIILIPICDSCKKSILLEGNASIPDTDLNYKFI